MAISKEEVNVTVLRAPREVAACQLRGAALQRKPISCSRRQHLD